MRGRIIKGVGGLYDVHVGGDRVYACRARGIFRKKKIRPNVGDYVEIEILSEQDKEGSITVIHERRNSLIRPMVANVDQALLVFAFHEPEPNYFLLNTFLVMMEQQGVPVILCFNKTDLSTPEERDYVRESFCGSGAQLHMVCAHKDDTEDIGKLLLGKTTVLAGPSGVGKSSLLNRISGTFAMETGEVSEKIKRGKHTTRHSELIYIGDDSYLVDTPGFSSLDLIGIEKEDLKQYFPEFSQCGPCRFLDCQHINEPECFVKQAVEDGRISRLRYENYCLMFENLNTKRKW